jgi:uncharacterized repeat protein (TIGR01451 family)
MRDIIRRHSRSFRTKAVIKTQSRNKFTAKKKTLSMDIRKVVSSLAILALVVFSYGVFPAPQIADAATQSAGDWMFFAYEDRATNTNNGKHVEIAGSTNTLHGDIKSNGDLDISGSSNTFNGILRYHDDQLVGGSGNAFNGGNPAQQNQTTWPGTLSSFNTNSFTCNYGALNTDTNHTLNSSSPDGVYCTKNGTIEASNQDIAGKFTFISKGGLIKINGSNFDLEPYVDGVLAYTGINTDWGITVTGSTGSTLNGLLFADNSGIKMEGSNTIYCVQAAGEKIYASGSTNIFNDCTPVETEPVSDFDITCDNVSINGNTWTFSGTWQAYDYQGLSTQYNTALFSPSGTLADASSKDSPDTFVITTPPGADTDFTGGNQEDMSGTWSNEIVFATPPASVSAMLYHSQVPGAESSGDAVCFFVLPPQNPTLTLVKQVTNDDGGATANTAWTLSASGPTPISGASGSTQVTNATVNAGVYNLSESNGPSGYTASGWVCTGTGTQNDSDTVTLANGQSATCTITNDDMPGTLTVIKDVVNNNGGGMEADDFTMNVTGTDVSDDSFPGSEIGTVITLDAGSYSVSETGPSGYAQSNSTGCSGTIANGESKTCTITNDDIEPGLTLVKIVVNDNNGSADADDFQAMIDEDEVPWNEAQNLIAGTYALSETNIPGYTASSWGCVGGSLDGNDVTIGVGDSVVCTITNDDQPGTLIVKKTIVGSNDTPDDFSFVVDDNDAIAFEADGQNNMIVDAGTYSVTEVTATGYQTTYDNCDDVVVANGGSATCTITNTRDSADLDIDKTVNDITANEGQEVTYTIVVDNEGPDDAVNVSVSDALPSCLTYVSSSTATGSYNEVTGIWTVGSLANNASATLTITVTVDCDPGLVENTAVVTSDTPDSNEDNNEDDASTTVPGRVTLTITTSGEGEGVVFDDNEDIDCEHPSVEGNDCTETYVQGTVVNLTADPDEGSNFNNSWSLISGSPVTNTCVGPTTPCTLTMNGNITLNAHFTLNQITPTPSPTPPPSGGGGGGGPALGSIAGVKFNDLNGNGVKDAGEVGLSGWVIYSDANNNGSFDAGEAALTTAADGTFNFLSLSSGAYNIREVNQAGWTQTLPGLGANFKYAFNVSSSNHLNTDFGNQQVQGQVLGARTEAPKPQVKGATLPRTGVPVWMLTLIGLSLVAIAGRKQAKA